MGQTDKDLLLDMGFQPLRVDLALKSTGGLQDALTWLEKHQDTPDDQLTAAAAATTSSSSATETGGKDADDKEDDDNGGEGSAGAEAKSYVCNDCGKKLRSWQAVQLHAENTEHQNFDESTEEVCPLTAEEKKAKLEELRARLAEKRQLEAASKVQEAKQNEAIRRKRDQDSQKIKDELRKKEMLKDVERKKQEKLDDLKARARIKAEIAETQRQRKEAAARAKAEREGKVSEEAEQQKKQEEEKPKPAAQTHTEARLRFQFSGGSGRGPLTKTFPAETTLFEVAAAVAEETGQPVKSFTTTFPPRKTYNFEDAMDVGLSLKEANLTPSASLLVG